MKRRFFFALVVVSLMQPACVQVNTTRRSAVLPGASAAVADRLYLGRGIPASTVEVSEQDWDRFLAEVVTPRFPAGLTFSRAQGQWRDDAGKIVAEQVFILEIIHPASAAADSGLAQIARAYKERFRQDAVLHVRTEARMKFY